MKIFTAMYILSSVRILNSALNLINFVHSWKRSREQCQEFSETQTTVAVDSEPAWWDSHGLFGKSTLQIPLQHEIRVRELAKQQGVNEKISS
jgi:hypothetical protein